MFLLLFVPLNHTKLPARTTFYNGNCRKYFLSYRLHYPITTNGSHNISQTRHKTARVSGEKYSGSILFTIHVRENIWSCSIHNTIHKRRILSVETRPFLLAHENNLGQRWGSHFPRATSKPVAEGQACAYGNGIAISIKCKQPVSAKQGSWWS
jgi:hypothetical protein